MPGDSSSVWELMTGGPHDGPQLRPGDKVRIDDDTYTVESAERGGSGTCSVAVIEFEREFILFYTDELVLRLSAVTTYDGGSATQTHRSGIEEVTVFWRDRLPETFELDR